MKDNTVPMWSRSFRRDAMKDGMSLFSNHLHGLNLPDEPEKLLEGTIMVVNACCAYLSIDGRPLNDFLAMQTYIVQRMMQTPNTCLLSTCLTKHMLAS